MARSFAVRPMAGTRSLACGSFPAIANLENGASSSSSLIRDRQIFDIVAAPLPHAGLDRA
ncbi:MAG: hypothetical protein J2P48_17350 [Alphaproteobacteria bacterium]|nr:hypothetical protein [Alphaproteobacteria bacterium]